MNCFFSLLGFTSIISVKKKKDTEEEIFLLLYTFLIEIVLGVLLENL